MNADRLLAFYDRVADAPDAVARLRRFVLDLAVRGKLLEQDPADEPASELLKRIQRARRKRVADGEMRPEKCIPAPMRDLGIFKLPPNWLWCVADNVWDFENGDRSSNYPSRDQLVSSGVPFINAGHLVKGRVSLKEMNFVTHEKFESLGGGKLRQGDQLYCLRGSLGKHAVFDNETDAAIASSLVILRPVLAECVPYCSLYLDSAVAEIMLRRFDNGSAQPNLSSANLRRFEIPLPPLAEQHRIISKVDELKALCDRLEEARTAREDTRDRLANASFARLSAPHANDVTFRSHTCITLDALPALTARVDQLQHLRQTILELAVRGRLVEQDPADDPLPRLEQAIPHDLQPPFPIPPNWRWSRLRALGILKGGGTPSKARDDFWNGSIPWVSPKDMKVDYIAEAKLNITEAAITGSAVNLIEPESILFVVRGMILAHSFPVAISRVLVTINQDMKAISLRKPEVAEYLLRALKGLKPEMLARVQRSSHGTCRIERTDYGDFLIPLPPLAEQHRIVARVDELIALCDRLEASLTICETTNRRLLESLLQDDLASVSDELEFAE